MFGIQELMILNLKNLATNNKMIFLTIIVIIMVIPLFLFL